MSLYALLRDAAYNKRNLTPEDIELSGQFDGNLCRCTGYVPILNAAKVRHRTYTQTSRLAEPDSRLLRTTFPNLVRPLKP